MQFFAAAIASLLRGVSLTNFSCASLVNFCTFLAHVGSVSLSTVIFSSIAADYSTSIACCNGSERSGREHVQPRRDFDAGQCVGKNFGTGPPFFFHSRATTRCSSARGHLAVLLSDRRAVFLVSQSSFARMMLAGTSRWSQSKERGSL